MDYEKIILKIIDLLHTKYIFPKKIIYVKKLLLENLANNKYSGLKDSAVIDKLNYDLYSILQDCHVYIYKLNKQDNKNNRKNLDKWMESKIINKKTGYIRFDYFPGENNANNFYNEMCKYVVYNFNKVNKCKYIIFDMRNNLGGSYYSLAFILSFLYKRAVTVIKYIFRDQKICNNFNVKTYPTKLKKICKCNDLPFLYEKKIICLTSKRTESCAENFCYDLQVRKKSVIVGETTKGGGYACIKYQINTNMYINISVANSKHPITQKNWECVGVKPNIVCKSSKALKCALRYVET